jgi:RHS repeat-associated protein
MGRVVGDGLDTFSWSILSELQRVTAGAGSTSTTEQYQYDGLGRLVARRNAAGSVIQEYAYDGSQMVVAWNASTTSVAWNATWGPGLDKLVSVAVGNTRYLALGDGRGSVGAYYNEPATAVGWVASTLDYTPEGRVKWRTFNSSGTQTNSCDQLGSAAAHTTDCDVGPNALPFGFHSAFKSPDSGLLYFRNRWLSTRTGEWLSPDPLGPVDSPNLYAFTGFDSVNRWDPFGLESEGLASGGASMEIQKTSGFNEAVFDRILYDNGFYDGLASDGKGANAGYRAARSAWDEVSSPTGNLGVARSGRGRGPMLACGACALVLPALEPLLVGGALTADALGLGIGVAGMGALSGISAGSRSDWLEGDPMDRKNVRNGQNLLNALRDTRKPPDNAVIASGRPASKPDLGKPDSATKPPGAQATPPNPTEPPKSPEPKAPKDPDKSPNTPDRPGRATPEAAGIKITKEMNSQSIPMAKGADIRKVDSLVSKFGGPAKDWSKVKTWDASGREIHYYSHPNHGKVGIKLAGQDDPF